MQFLSRHIFLPRHLMTVIALCIVGCDGESDRVLDPVIDPPVGSLDAGDDRGDTDGGETDGNDGRNDGGETDASDQTPNAPAHCFDTQLSGDETDVDCGGSCTACLFEQSCADSDDCAVGLACGGDDGVCDYAACENTFKDEGETDQDCGGPECHTRCGEGDACIETSDCDNLRCDLGVCQPPSCNDDLRNGRETGKDCGGPDCPGCPAGGACFTRLDCANNFTEPADVAFACNQVLTAETCRDTASVPYVLNVFDCDESNVCQQTTEARTESCVRNTEGFTCEPNETQPTETFVSPAGVEDGVGCSYLNPCDNRRRRRVYQLAYGCDQGACISSYLNGQLVTLDCESTDSRNQGGQTCRPDDLAPCVNNTNNVCAFGERLVNSYTCDAVEQCNATASVRACTAADYSPGDRPLGGSCGGNICRLGRECRNVSGGGGPGCSTAGGTRDLNEFRRRCNNGGCREEFVRKVRDVRVTIFCRGCPGCGGPTYPCNQTQQVSCGLR